MNSNFSFAVAVLQLKSIYQIGLQRIQTSWLKNFVGIQVVHTHMHTCTHARARTHAHAHTHTYAHALGPRETLLFRSQLRHRKYLVKAPRVEVVKQTPLKVVCCLLPLINISSSQTAPISPRRPASCRPRRASR